MGGTTAYFGDPQLINTAVPAGGIDAIDPGGMGDLSVVRMPWSPASAPVLPRVNPNEYLTGKASGISAAFPEEISTTTANIPATNAPSATPAAQGNKALWNQLVPDAANAYTQAYQEGDESRANKVLDALYKVTGYNRNEFPEHSLENISNIFTFRKSMMVPSATTATGKPNAGPKATASAVPEKMSTPEDMTPVDKGKAFKEHMENARALVKETYGIDPMQSINVNERAEDMVASWYVKNHPEDARKNGIPAGFVQQQLPSAIQYINDQYVKASHLFNTYMGQLQASLEPIKIGKEETLLYRTDKGGRGVATGVIPVTEGGAAIVGNSIIRNPKSMVVGENQIGVIPGVGTVPGMMGAKQGGLVHNPYTNTTMRGAAPNLGNVAPGNVSHLRQAVIDPFYGVFNASLKSPVNMELAEQIKRQQMLNTTGKTPEDMPATMIMAFANEAKYLKGKADKTTDPKQKASMMNQVGLLISYINKIKSGIEGTSAMIGRTGGTTVPSTATE